MKKIILVIFIITFLVFIGYKMLNNAIYNEWFGKQYFAKSNEETIKNKLNKNGVSFEFIKPADVNYRIINSNIYELNPRRTKDNAGPIGGGNRFVWLKLSIFYTKGDMSQINKYFSDTFYDRFVYIGNEKFGENSFRVYKDKYRGLTKKDSLYITRFGDYDVVIENSNFDYSREIVGFDQEFEKIMSSVNFPEFRTDYNSEIIKFLMEGQITITSDYVEKYGTSAEVRKCYDERLISVRDKCLEKL